MKREAANHLNTLLAMIAELSVMPTPSDIGRLQGQATKFRIWYEPMYCEATLVRHCEDTGVLCGKPCEPGHSLCADHLSEVNGYDC